MVVQTSHLCLYNYLPAYVLYILVIKSVLDVAMNECSSFQDLVANDPMYICFDLQFIVFLVVISWYTFNYIGTGHLYDIL